MHPSNNDPLGRAAQDYLRTGIDRDIIVESDLCEDDVLSSAYLFRNYDEMPLLEQMAIDRASGRILDVGAGAGAHSRELKRRGMNVRAIDTSAGGIECMLSEGIDARLLDFFELKDEQYDTLLFLMNGIGIGGHLETLKRTLMHAKSLLAPGGRILCDSTDLKYLYEDDDGSYWMDLNANYYGEICFNMRYEDQSSGWFNWLYVDFESFRKVAEECGFRIELLHEEENQYLAELCR